MNWVGRVSVLSGWILSYAFWLGAAAHAQQLANVQQPSRTPTQQTFQAANVSPGETNSQPSGSIAGTVLDQSGAAAVGAKVRLTRPNDPHTREVSSGDNGQFSFDNLAPGLFQLTVEAPDFETRTFTGSLQPGQVLLVPEMVLKVAQATTTVQVGLPTDEVAEIQIKQQEKQRVLGIAPNFYVSYIPDAAPLNVQQKFQLALRAVTDPVTILGVGALAGVHQATNDYGGLGQEAGGYGKRFSVAYAARVTGFILDDAVLASLFKQDPRYFYQGTGSTRSRLAHALSHAIVRKGDNGRSQPNYSGIIGSFATAGITSFYYPESDRNGSLVIQNALVGIAGRAVGGVFQEFVLRKFTSHATGQTTSRP